MEVLTDKNIRVIDTLFDPNSSEKNEIQYYKGADNLLRYKVWIFLDGKDTRNVDYVIYRLHSNFSDPVRRVNRTITNHNCELVIWTWGTFELGIEIVLRTGEKISASHQMSFDTSA